MNTAIADGFDLGWKLAWVLRGWAAAALLDTYETERRPIVEHNLARSADPDGSLRDVGDEVPADLGGRIPHLWLPGSTGRTSTIDLAGPRSHAVHDRRVSGRRPTTSTPRSPSPSASSTSSPRARWASAVRTRSCAAPTACRPVGATRGIAPAIRPRRIWRASQSSASRVA